MSDFHPRLYVNPCCLPGCTTIAQYLKTLDELGLTRTGAARPRMLSEGWEGSMALYASAKAEVGYLSYNRVFALGEPETWEQSSRELLAVIDTHEAFGSRIYCLTGPGPAAGLSWEDATAAFVKAIGPASAHARKVGASLSLEPTNSAFSDIHCLHTLKDTLDICEAADLDITLEVDPCWMERDLAATIRRAGPRIGLVQLSDRKLGSRSMDRAVPGDGVVPLPQIIEWILETGYQGPLDLELWGDTGRGEVEGTLRGLDYLTNILNRLGA